MQRNDQSKQLSPADRWALLRSFSIDAALAIACVAVAAFGATMSRWW